MSWYKKSQADNAMLVLMVMMQKASQPGYMFEDELLKFQDYQPQDIERAIMYAYSQFPNLNEQQQGILWHLQEMINGTNTTLPKDMNEDQDVIEDQNVVEGMPVENPIV